MRIVFFGTPDFAVASLKSLCDSGFEVVAAVTAPDKPAGRGHKLKASPVKEYALEQSIPVLQPTNLKSTDFIEELKSYNADVQVVVAFRMLPEVVWNMPKLGTYNVHASLLPNYRGAAPINWAIINGEQTTGVTSFKLKHEIDTGSIALQEEVNIGTDENVGELYQRLMTLGGELIVKTMELLKNDGLTLKPQTESAAHKHAPKLFKENCRIDWSGSMEETHNFVRGLSPFPGAFSHIEVNTETQSWKIHRTNVPAEQPSSDQSNSLVTFKNKLYARCANGYLEILELQLPGKKRMSAIEFLNGWKHRLGDVQLR